MKNILVNERFNLTPFFAERVFKRYARRIGAKVMPVEAVDGELLSPDFFGEPVRVKAGHLVHELGKRGPWVDGGTQTDFERATHAAMQAAADAYGFGKLPVPLFGDEPPAPKPDAKGGGDKKRDDKPKDRPEPKPEDKKPDEGKGDEGKDKPADSDSKPDGDTPGDGEGKGDDGDSKDTDADGDKADGDGKPGEQSGDDGDGKAPDGTPEDDPTVEATSCENGNEEIDPETKGAEISRAAPKLSLNLHEQRMEFAAITVPELPEPSGTKLRPFTNYSSFDHSADMAGQNQLMARIRNELMSYSRHRYSRDKDQGSVDFTKLADLAAGTNLDRAFYSMTHAKRLNACVQILIDGSSSMGNGDGSKMHTGAVLAYMVASVCEVLRVPCQVLVENGWAFLVKDWHQKLDQTKVQFMYSSGGNCMPHAMTEACAVLAGRREQKHIQLITTDGDIGWTTKATRDFYRSMSHTQQPGEEYGNYAARIMPMHGQFNTENAGGYTGDAGPYARKGEPITTDQLEARLLGLYKADPKLRTYGFGLEIDVPPGLFHRTFNRLTKENMVEVVVETLSKALTSIN